MSTLKDEIDALQVKHLGANPRREKIAEYFNTCLNSACGAVADKYGNIGVWGLLQVWVATVQERVEADEAAQRKPQ